MDRKTLIAVVVCLIVFLSYPLLLQWVGLGHYLAPPTRVSAPADTSATAVQEPPAGLSAPKGTDPVEPPVLGTPEPPAPAPAAAALAERIIEVETPLYRARFSNRGARLLDVELKGFAAAPRRAVDVPGESGQAPPAGPVRLDGGPLFAMDLGAGTQVRPLADRIFDVAESLDASGAIRSVTFSSPDPSGALLRQAYRMRPDEYAIDYEVEIAGIPVEWRVDDYTVATRSWSLAHENDPVDEERSLRASSLVGTNLRREAVGGLEKAPKVFEGSAFWSGVQTRYFSALIAITEGTAKSATAAVAQRPLTTEERDRHGPDAKSIQSVAVGSLVVGLPGGSTPVHRYLIYVGPNEYFRLARLGHGLERIVDLGWSWITPLSKLLLQLLVWLHGLVLNYGVAILVLATLARVLLHPLSMMGIRSMREMQKVQPEVERLRAKYKNDAQAMNTAMMALYKEHKINPAGGCLPMLLQMPLFIALYSVLFNATELRQAPFVSWINDLSAPDVLFWVANFPIRLLPVLMTVSGFIQQMVTPTDPRQATTFYFMNVIMLVFFYNLPSGLVLYWTVMNLLTAFQQWIALREVGSAPALASQVTGRGGAK